ncbi:type I-E CRISPR-associated protein Cas6/Cse3/CasE [Streptomyces sp. NPDC002640]
MVTGSGLLPLDPVDVDRVDRLIGSRPTGPLRCPGSRRKAASPSVPTEREKGAVIARRLARNPTFLQATRLEGLALIADPIALQGAVLSGIGRGRAYGLGLLCLRPADTDVSPVLHL